MIDKGSLVEKLGKMAGMLKECIEQLQGDDYEKDMDEVLNRKDGDKGKPE